MTTHRTRVAQALLAAFLLGACSSGESARQPDGIPPVVEELFVPVVSATGQVVPHLYASLSLPSSGVVASVEVSEGDAVASGAVLLRLAGRERLEAALAAARLDEVLATQALDRVYDEADLARALAEQAMALARDEFRKEDYDRTVQQEGNRASDDTIKRARANVTLAQARADDAKDAYDSTPGSTSDPAKAAAQAAYLSAKAALDSARRSLNWYTGHPTEIQQAMLDADVAVAEARLAEAERAWDRLENGPDPDLLEQAQARLRQSQAAVSAAEAALRDTELRAPFAGSIGAVMVRPMEFAAPGAPLIDLADLARLQVETTDLSEVDVRRVRVGAPATITFDALPDVQVGGRVTRIAPKASPGSGVNYTVWVSLDEIPQGLLWGMTAFVDIEAAP